jgi:endonuclease YncB( thermonuclease family)
VFPSRRGTRRRPSLAALLGLALIALVVGRWLLNSYLRSTPPESDAALVEGPCEVVRVLEGPMLLVRQKSPHAETTVTRRVRLIGIETQANRSADLSESPSAERFLEDAIDGREVRLQFDKRRVDREHNWLAYVYAGETLLNERLLEEGLARLHEYPGDSASIAKRLRGAEAKAKAAGRGLWSGQLVTKDPDG